MRFEWDAKKAASNLAKHGVTFEQATLAWDGPTLVYDAAHPTEARQVLLGLVGEYLIAVVYVMRGEATRIISARFASRQERRRYGIDE